jgi:hypothetical protein
VDDLCGRAWDGVAVLEGAGCELCKDVLAGCAGSAVSEDVGDWRGTVVHGDAGHREIPEDLRTIGVVKYHVGCPGIAPRRLGCRRSNVLHRQL